MTDRNLVSPGPIPADDNAAAVEALLRSRLELLSLANRIGVARACRQLNQARSTYARIKAAYDKGGVPGLRAWVKRCVSRDRGIGGKVEEAVLAMTRANPHWGRNRVSKAVRERGLPASPTRVWNIWKKHNLLVPARSGSGWLEGAVAPVTPTSQTPAQPQPGHAYAQATTHSYHPSQTTTPGYPVAPYAPAPYPPAPHHHQAYPAYPSNTTAAHYPTTAPATAPVAPAPVAPAPVAPAPVAPAPVVPAATAPAPAMVPTPPAPAYHAAPPHTIPAMTTTSEPVPSRRPAQPSTTNPTTVRVAAEPTNYGYHTGTADNPFDIKSSSQ